jgi:hypothetical protein
MRIPVIVATESSAKRLWCDFGDGVFPITLMKYLVIPCGYT